MYVLTVHFDILFDHVAAFDHLLDETVTAVQATEPGTIVYLAHDDPSDPLVRVLYECYRDELAFLEHERAPHTQRFLDRRGELLAGPPTVTVLHATTGSIQGVAYRV